MKNKLIFLLAIYCSLGYAQQNINIGLELGISTSDLRGNVISSNNKSLIGFVPAITLEKDLDGKFSLKTGILYEQKGSKVTYSQFDPITLLFIEEKIINKFHQISLPILLKYRTSGKFSFFINAGPNFGFLFKNEEISVKKFDIGINSGLGIQRNFLTGNMYIEVRNTLGLLNISDIPFSSESELKSNSFYFLVGYSHSI